MNLKMICGALFQLMMVVGVQQVMAVTIGTAQDGLTLRLEEGRIHARLSSSVAGAFAQGPYVWHAEIDGVPYTGLLDAHDARRGLLVLKYNNENVEHSAVNLLSKESPAVIEISVENFGTQTNRP